MQPIKKKNFRSRCRNGFDLIEKYLAGENITDEVLTSALGWATKNGSIALLCVVQGWATSGKLSVK
jgi:hypothetical protein